MATENRHDLTCGPVATHLRRQATPFGLGLIAIFSFEAADLFFISRLGDDPLAAISFCFPVIWLIYGIGIGFEAGAASCVSRAIGRGDAPRANRLTTDTVVLAGAVALALTFAGLASVGVVFPLLGAPDRLLPLIAGYMGTWYWVAPLDMVLWCALASMRARGNAPLESKIIVAAAVLNLGLDPILIFGLFGFPRLEMQGAALATVISTGTVLLFTLIYLGRKLGVFAGLRTSWRTRWDSWKHLLHIGIPAIATNAIIPVSTAIVVALLAGYGADAVAGYGIAMRIEPMFLIPFYALSAVTSPFFGQNSSAGLTDRLIDARRAIARFCLGFGLLLAVALWFAAKPLAGLFSDSPEILGIAVDYLRIVPISFGAYGMVMSINAAFNGMGKPLPGVVISACRVIVLFLPLALLGRWLLGPPGLFAASTVSNLVLGWAGFAWLGRVIRR